MEELKNFMMTKKRFRDMVEDTVRKLSISHLDAIIQLCEQYNIEVEDVGKYMTQPIKDKLEADAMKLNFLVGSNSFVPLE